MATFIPAIAAPLIQEIRPLDFGTFAVTANAASSSLTLPYNGAAPTISGQIVWVAAGQPGLYRLTGYPAYTPLTLTLTPGTLSAGGTGNPEYLTITAFNHPASITTDATGSADLPLGGTLTTSGSGANYIDAPYRGFIDITIFW